MSKNSFADKVDWIGTNIYPWWENQYSGVHTCVPAEKAADFQTTRLEEINKAYPNKELVLTEFGWPSGPEGGSTTNLKTGEHCGIASKKNQKLVIESTFKQLAKKKRSGVVFEASQKIGNQQRKAHSENIGEFVKVKRLTLAPRNLRFRNN